MTSLPPVSLETLAQEQAELAQHIIIPPNGMGYQPQNGDLLITLDVQYVGEQAFVAADLLQWPDQPVTTVVKEFHVQFPYISQYFCFREGPLLQQMVNYVIDNYRIQPDFLLIDGHGRAHPRLFGIACWVGLKLGLPTIGCAKEPLLRYDKTAVPISRGSTSPLTNPDPEGVPHILGNVVVTQSGVRPLFVSPGHGIALNTAVEVILTLACRYRQPEPIRRADHAARQASKSK